MRSSQACSLDTHLALDAQLPCMRERQTRGICVDKPCQTGWRIKILGWRIKNFTNKFVFQVLINFEFSIRFKPNGAFS